MNALLACRQCSTFRPLLFHGQLSSNPPLGVMRGWQTPASRHVLLNHDFRQSPIQPEPSSVSSLCSDLLSSLLLGITQSSEPSRVMLCLYVQQSSDGCQTCANEHKHCQHLSFRVRTSDAERELLQNCLLLLLSLCALADPCHLVQAPRCTARSSTMSLLLALISSDTDERTGPRSYSCRFGFYLPVQERTRNLLFFPRWLQEHLGNVEMK